MAKKILAIGAHSDDIEFYAGGTLAKMAKENEVIFVIATDGRHGTHADISQELLVKKRKEEQTRAATHIGVKEIIFLDFEDSELEFHKQALKQKLLDICIDYKPDIIFTFDSERQYILHDDFHPDHRTLALATLDVILIDATLPSKGGVCNFCPELYLYNAHRPTLQVDITDTLDTKCRALKEYGSQFDVLEKQFRSAKTELFYKYR